MAKKRPKRMKRDKLEEKLGQLSALRDEPVGPVMVESVRAALQDKSPHLVARAADLAAEALIHGLADELAHAFDRLMQGDAKQHIDTDKGCVAKTAIAKALLALESPRDDAYLLGVAHIQLEPAWGKPVDTAIELRCTCCLGLALGASSDVMIHLVDRMNDAEARVRAAAAHAVGAAGRPEGEYVLRLKAHVGDGEPEVMTECYTSLLALAFDRSLPLVASRLLTTNPDIGGAAAIALGQSREPKALDALIGRLQALGAVAGQLTPSILLAMAIHRSEPAFEYLLGMITDSSPLAAEAVDALAIHRGLPTIRDRVAAAVAQSTRAAQRRFAERFE